MGYWHGPLHVRLNLPAQPVKRWQVASYTFKKLEWESDHVRRYLDDDRICPMVMDTSHCLTTRYILHTSNTRQQEMTNQLFNQPTGMVGFT